MTMRAAVWAIGLCLAGAISGDARACIHADSGRAGANRKVDLTVAAEAAVNDGRSRLAASLVASSFPDLLFTRAGEESPIRRCG